MNYSSLRLSMLYFLCFSFACSTQTVDPKVIVDKETTDFNNSQAALRSNEVCFNLNKIDNFHFDKNGGLDITNQQPWEGYYQKKDKYNVHKIIIMAGRKKSNSVAKWFRKNIKNGVAIGCTAITSLPLELNFAMKGSITFDYVGKHYQSDEILIGQGNRDFRNNWWFGAENASRYYASDLQPVLIIQAYCTTEPITSIALVIKESSNKDMVNSFDISIINS